MITDDVVRNELVVLKRDIPTPFKVKPKKGDVIEILIFSRGQGLSDVYITSAEYAAHSFCVRNSEMDDLFVFLDKKAAKILYKG